MSKHPLKIADSMKVLMIAPEPFLESRGTPISVYQRIRALASLGHTVDLLTYHLGRDVSIPGVRIHRIPPVPFVKDVRVGPSWSKMFLDVILFCKAITMLAARRYDVIHSHEEAAFFSVILAAMFRTRHLYDMHSSLPRQLANFRFGNYRPIIRLFETLEKWTINSCDAVITISADLEQHVKEMNPEVELEVIENSVVGIAGEDVDRRAVDQLKEQLGLNDKLPIVYTGTLEHYQGMDLLIDSANIVRKRYPEVLFLLIGGKPQQVEYWKRETRKRYLEDCVLFLGTVPVEEIGAYLEIAEILVSPRTEGTSVPLKIYSYLHSGKPIVATNLAAHTLVLNEDVAVLVAPTKEAFAGGIMKLLRTPDLRQRLGLQARKYAEKVYAPADYLARLDRIYRATAINV